MLSNLTRSTLGQQLIKSCAVVTGNDPAESNEAIHMSLGAGLLATFPPNECCQIRLRVACNLATVLLRARAFFAQHGENENTALGPIARSPFPHVSGVIRCGLIRKLPALVHVEVLTHTPSLCLLLITAAATEGLFHQQVAQIAAQRTANYICAEIETV